MNSWEVKERNVSICEQCNGNMALWYNRAKGLYCLSCDYCDNEYCYTKEEVEWTGVINKYIKEKEYEKPNN